MQLKQIVLCLIAFPLLHVTITRFLILANSFPTHYTEIQRLESIRDKCFYDEDVHVLFEKDCEAAKRFPVTSFPFFMRLLLSSWYSFGTMVDHTHSCIYYPCSDLIRAMETSYVTYFLLTGIIIVLGVIVFMTLHYYVDSKMGRNEPRYWFDQPRSLPGFAVEMNDAVTIDTRYLPKRLTMPTQRALIQNDVFS